MECCLTTMADEILKGIHLELWETEQDKIYAEDLMKKANLESGEKIIAFGLTASVPLKQWPLSCYCELMSQLKARVPSLHFVLLGDLHTVNEDTTFCKDTLNLCGQLTLRETVALLRYATLYIGNDTGLMHIASACGCAVVEISSFARDGDDANGISSGSRFSPWSKEALIVQPLHQLEGCAGMCQMPYAHCITQVSVEAVFEAACRLLTARGIVAG